MRRYVVSVLAAAASIGFVSSAIAADLPAKAPVYKAPVAVPFTWTGFYAGANVGGAFSNSGQITELAPGVGQVAWDGTGNIMPLGRQSRLIGGLQIGYNYQMNQFVLGIEADIDAMRYNVSAAEQTPAGVILTGGDVIGSKTADWLGTVRARLGMAFDRTLVYATGGAAFSNLKYSVVDACNTGGCGGGLTSGSVDVHTGWAVGGGAEYALNNNWSVKGEYIYASFASKTFTTSATTSVAITPWGANSTNFHVVRLGLNYLFR